MTGHGQLRLNILVDDINSSLIGSSINVYLGKYDLDNHEISRTLRYVNSVDNYYKGLLKIYLPKQETTNFLLLAVTHISEDSNGIPSTDTSTGFPTSIGPNYEYYTITAEIVDFNDISTTNIGSSTPSPSGTGDSCIDGDSDPELNISFLPHGSQGLQGTQGVQGLQGLQGPQGLQGLQGLSNQGTQGLQGIQGVQGPQGLQGLQGLSNQGTQGLQGIQGLQGTQGAQGVQGPQGLQGLQGNIANFQGTQGLQGVEGANSKGLAILAWLSPG